MLFAAVHLSGIVFTQADGTQHGWPLKKGVIYTVSKNLPRAQNKEKFSNSHTNALFIIITRYFHLYLRSK